MGNCELKITQALRDKVSTYNTTPEHIADARLSGETISAISRETGIPRTTLMNILRDMGLGDLKNKWGKQNEIDEKWLREQLVDKQREVREVATELGVSKNVVWRAATAAGIMEERKASKADTICARKRGIPRLAARAGRRKASHQQRYCRRAGLVCCDGIKSAQGRGDRSRCCEATH